ncbi:hypothetical protein PMAA_082100 [Talaromyces marneffei ATCC 18224]|uniref:Uncharacterized protein n=1 Tax=Talaromyces marneffei (strain ATCC 18224 / CBS 334.59 / QM 7333) TaxID=441960 RepID=B6QFG9_TALMQ|nr:hypothetical protein PMAA_082100 [Talaromyces marneffei ATCC 18224]
MTAFKGANDPRTDPLAQAAEIESNINDRAGIRAYAEEIYKGLDTYDTFLDNID